MKKSLLFIVFCILTLPSYSQVKIGIDSIAILYVVDSLMGNTLVDENLQKGPYINCYVCVENQGREPIVVDRVYLFDRYGNELCNDEYDIYYIYQCGNKLYKRHFLYYIGLQSPVKLLPGEKIHFKLKDWLFLGTDIYKGKGSDYSKEVIEALPTLQIVLKYQGKEYKNCGINKVIYVERNPEY